jgi:DNA-binding beta-propeller fold protein YncE
MNLTLMTISPSMAKSILENNFKNRRVDKKRVDQYANDMLAGKWKNNTGETLKITTSNKFIDGQHRLHAVIKANILVQFAVIMNVADDTMDVIDTGKSRSTSDIFYMSNIKNGNTICAFLNIYLTLKKGYASIQDVNSNKNTSQDILLHYNQNPEYFQTTGNHVINWYQSFGKILTTSLIGGFYLYLKDINENDSKEFMNQLCTGANITNNAILLLRKKLINDKTSKLNKMPRRLRTALIIKTWNYFRKNQDINILRFIEIKEEYPKAI